MNRIEGIVTAIVRQRRLYDKPALDPQAVADYAEALGDMLPADVEDAFRAHSSASGGAFWPHPGVLVKIHREAHRPPVPPAAAFDMVVQAYSRGVQPDGGPVGAKYTAEGERDHRMREILPPVVFEALDLLGGWRWVAHMPEAQYSYERHRFAEIVADLMDAAEASRRLAIAQDDEKAPLAPLSPDQRRLSR